MLPHERSLVQRFENRPFAMIGISVDKDKAELRRFLNGRKISWPTWFDPEGEIAKQWQIEVLPTVYVIDAEGIVRHRFEGDHEGTLDRAIEALVIEAEKKKH